MAISRYEQENRYLINCFRLIPEVYNDNVLLSSHSFINSYAKNSNTKLDKVYEYVLNNFKEEINLKDKYNRYDLFRTRILKPMIEKINAKTDLIITYKPYKEGRKIVGLIFTILEKEKIIELENINKTYVVSEDEKNKLLVIAYERCKGTSKRPDDFYNYAEKEAKQRCKSKTREGYFNLFKTILSKNTTFFAQAAVENKKVDDQVEINKKANERIEKSYKEIEENNKSKKEGIEMPDHVKKQWDKLGIETGKLVKQMSFDTD